MLPILVLLLFSPAAWAAGGDMPSLVHDIGISLLAAGALGVIFTRLKIPSIAAFLLAGVIVGPLGLKQVTDPANVDTIAQLGFILLLFLIGLEIDLKKIMASGKPIIVSGLLQFPLTIVFGIAAVKVMLAFGIGGSLLADSPHAALYIGVIVACSSTLLVVKLFQEHFELDTVPGRLSLGILIFQDIWVIIAILIQPNLQNPDLGLIAMAYGYVYVARVAMGFNDQQTLKAILEAESYDGPSLVIAYTPCIAHGFDMAKGLEQQKLAVTSGAYPVYRYDPRLADQGKNPFMIDTKEPTTRLEDYVYNETRYRMLLQSDEERAEKLLNDAKQNIKSRWALYKQMAAMSYNGESEE
jgi:hypothetical protein